MSIKEYAALKGVTRRTVERWVKQGYVAIDRIGPKGHVRITGERSFCPTLSHSALRSSRAH